MKDKSNVSYVAGFQQGDKNSLDREFMNIQEAFQLMVEKMKQQADRIEILEDEMMQLQEELVRVLHP